MNSLKLNWKTTLSGVLGFVAVLCYQCQHLLDDDPATNPDIFIIMAAGGALMAAVFARDAVNKKDGD